MKIEKYFDKQAKKELWKFDVTINGERIRRGKFLSRRDAEIAIAAERLIGQRKELGLPSPVPPVSLKEFVEVARKKSKRPLQRQVLQLLADVVSPNKAMIDLKRVDMAAFLERLQARNLSDATLNRYKQALYGMLNKGGEWFEALDDWQPPKFPKLAKPRARQRVLSVDELAALFAVWRNSDCLPRESAKWRDYRLELYDMARLMLLTAARREEIETIQIGDINFRESWLNLRSGKTRRSHAVALNEPAIEILRARASRQPMFSTLAPSVIHYVCQRVGREAHLTAGHKNNLGWTIHDMRRTAATYIESNGIAYSAVKSALGHARHDVTATYTPAQIKELRRAAELLQKHWREIDEVLQVRPALWKSFSA